MKAKILSIALLITILLSTLAIRPGIKTVMAQAGTETPATAAPTQAPTAVEPTAAPLASETPTSFPDRPLIVVNSYTVTGGSVSPGQGFDLTLKLYNMSRLGSTGYARNVILTYSGGDFLPVDTGGVRAINEMDPQEAINVVQPFVASSSLVGAKYASLTVNVSYTDLAGAATYSESFNITVPITQSSGGGGAARPTATPTAVSRPQLVVGSYGTDVTPLQPGTMFTLDLKVTNLGNADSRSVTMILGGGTADTGTPGAGGVSGAGSDLSIFAPLGSSNLVFLGDLPAGGTIEASVPLVVNVTASPAAYAFKISFVYDDTKGQRQSNDQIITLLVFQLPQIEIGYYRDPGVFMSGNMNALPMQITNLGKKSTVFGNMTITSPNADISNGVSLVGALDPGGYFTLDANVMPYQAGPLTFDITVNYTDDFNQPRTIVQTMTIDVMEMPTPEPIPSEGEGGMPPDGGMNGGSETFWQKVMRFFKGLFGLDSSPSNNNGTPLEPGMPVEEFPSEPVKPIEPVPGGKG